jgi:anti-anti-sigma factor
VHVTTLDVVETEARPRAIRVTLVGELDLHSAYALDRRLLDIEARQPELVVVDLRQVTMIDSAGLARLVSAQRRSRKGGWRLVLVKGSRTIQRVLQTTGLSELLEMTTDPDTLLSDG